jgi:hypothetical protein
MNAGEISTNKGKDMNDKGKNITNSVASTKNVEESARLGREVGAVAQQCFRNAFKVIEYVPGYENAWYVEGVVACGPLLTEHGWVERDGEVLDPTRPDGRMAYFPGLRFRGQAGVAEALRLPKPSRTDPDLPFLYRFGWGGYESPEFRRAWEDARAFVS